MAVSEKFWSEISAFDLIAWLAADKAFEQVGLSHSELDAIHSVSDISLAISEKFWGEISVVDLIAELISVLDLIA